MKSWKHGRSPFLVATGVTEWAKLKMWKPFCSNQVVIGSLNLIHSSFIISVSAKKSSNPFKPWNVLGTAKKRFWLNENDVSYSMAAASMKNAYSPSSFLTLQVFRLCYNPSFSYFYPFAIEFSPFLHCTFSLGLFSAWPKDSDGFRRFSLWFFLSFWTTQLHTCRCIPNPQTCQFHYNHHDYPVQALAVTLGHHAWLCRLHESVQLGVRWNGRALQRAIWDKYILQFGQIQFGLAPQLGHYWDVVDINISRMVSTQWKFKSLTPKKAFVDPQQKVPYLIFVCFARSSAEFTGDDIFDAVKKAATNHHDHDHDHYHYHHYHRRHHHHHHHQPSLPYRRRSW